MVYRGAEGPDAARGEAAAPSCAAEASRHTCPDVELAVAADPSAPSSLELTGDLATSALSTPEAAEPDAALVAIPPEAAVDVFLTSPESHVSPPKAAPKRAGRRMMPCLAPQAKKESAPSKRVGGGFTGQPQAPPKPAVKPAPRSKNAKSASPEPVEEPKAPQKSPEEVQREAVVQSMTTADHFLGLLNFERAADTLEQVLHDLSAEAAPLRHGDLHLDVLGKYGGVLWWDGDVEGAVDAFTAQDEILADRPDAPTVRRARVDVWAQLAQVYRGCGDVEKAEQHLSDSVRCLSELLTSGPLPDGAVVACEDALREAQACLGQICVLKGDYPRAEELYMAAFSPGTPPTPEPASEPPPK